MPTTIDCPWCAGEATLDAAMTAVSCDGCGVAAEVADDPTPVALDAAA